MTYEGRDVIKGKKWLLVVKQSTVCYTMFNYYYIVFNIIIIVLINITFVKENL